MSNSTKVQQGSELRKPEYSSRVVAKAFLERDWSPIPIPPGQKGPVLKNWQKTKIQESEIEEYFTPEDNVGILLGKPSGDLIDVDLDSKEANLLGSIFLPPTAAIFGRPSKPMSHWLYLADQSLASLQFKDIGGRMIAEIRSTGCQTVFPPSHHSGEQVTWKSDGLPAKIAGEYLHFRVGLLATAALLAAHWPESGSRQEAALALAGALLREGYEEGRVAIFIRAVARAAGDEETKKRADAAEYTNRKIQAGEKVTGWTRLESLLGLEVVRLARKWLSFGITGDAIHTGSTARQTTPRSGVNGKNEGHNILDLLIASADEAETFHSSDGSTFITFPVKEHKETWRINSPATRHWLASRFLERFQTLPSRKSIGDAIEVLEDRALHEGQLQQVFIRIASLDGSIYLDLGRSEWQAIEITQDGWIEVPNPPVRFRRPARLKPLPLPEKGGNINDLRGLLNAKEDNAWTLLIGWLIGCFHPAGPYLVLVLQGEAGTAKSTTARILRSLIDPATPPLTSMPSKEDDLLISAKNSWVLGFDNVSSLPHWMSDCICRLATGAGLSKRKLFTDEDEVILEASRPVILTGIEDLTSREDLAERSISLILPPIPSEQRRLERKLQPALKERYPRVLGALLDAVSSALKCVGETELLNPPRMADAVEWISAAETALGWQKGSFQKAFEENQNDGAVSSLETDLVASAIVALMGDYPTWEGTATDLLVVLNTRVSQEAQKNKTWPTGARAMGGRVRRIAPALRKVEVEIEFSRVPETRSRLISIHPKGLVTNPTVSTVPIVPEAVPELDERDGRDDESPKNDVTRVVPAVSSEEVQ